MANERARGLGYKFVTDDKYLVDPFSPTDGISYEGDGSPVSYANSGIMTEAPIIYPPVNQGGGDGGDDFTGPTGPGSYDSTFDPETQNKQFNEDIGVGTVAEEDDEKGTSLGIVDALRAMGAFTFGGPLNAGYSLKRSVDRNKQKEIDKINKKIEAQYGPSDPGSRGRDDTPGFGKTSTGNYTNQFEGGDPGLMADGGRAGYFFGGRVNYKTGGRTGYFLGGNIEGGYSESQKDSGGKQTTTSYSGGNNDGGSQNINVTKEIQKAIEKKIPKTEDAPLMSDKIKKYFTLSNNNRSIDSRPFLRNPKKTKNLYTNNLTNLNIQYPNIDIKDEYGYIQGDKAKSLIDRAIAEGTISPVEGLNLTRSIDTTGTQSNTSGDYTMGNFNFSSPNIEEGILNSKANYNLGDLNLNANLNTNDSTINDSRLGFNYDNDSLTGSTYRDNDYGYTTNKLGVDKTFNIGDNFKVGLDGSYQEDKFKDGSYYNADLTPSLKYNDGTFNANLSKEIVEGGTQPSLGIGFQKNGFYGQGNNLLSDPTGKIGFQYSTGPETYTSRRGEFKKQGVNFTGGFEINPFTGQKTAGAYLSKPFKNGGLAGLL